MLCRPRTIATIDTIMKTQLLNKTKSTPGNTTLTTAAFTKVIWA